MLVNGDRILNMTSATLWGSKYSATIQLTFKPHAILLNFLFSNYSMSVHWI